MKKFKIPTPSKTTPKTIRFPDTLIADIEKEIAGTECTFSAFVVEASKNAVKQLCGKK